MTSIDTLTRITGDIYQVRLPLPFALNHVNCYLLRDANKWVVVDTGLNTPPARDVWRSALNDLQIKPVDVNRIILTHHHPDHYGLAGWFQEWCASQNNHPAVYMSPRETELAHLIWGGGGKLAHAFSDYLKACAMPMDMSNAVIQGFQSTAAQTLPHPIHLAPLQPNTTVTIGQHRFQLIHAPGHSDGQLILYDEVDKILLCGDHLLMKITPNVGLWPDSEPRPLQRYIDSLRSLLALNVRLALPGHRTLITDWHGRIIELIDHHTARLEHTLAAVGDGTTVFEASLNIFPKNQFSPHEWRFAMAETLAHLEYLEHEGQIIRHLRDGRWWFNRPKP